MDTKAPVVIEALALDRFNEAKRIHRTFILFSVVYLVFSVADYVYSPERFLEFFILRLCYCIVPISIFLIVPNTTTFRQNEILAAFHATVAAGIITYMIATTDGIESPYYAGLNLVAIIALSFFAFSGLFYAITAGLIYLPYFVFCLYSISREGFSQTFILNSFFMLGTLIVCTVIFHFREYYRSASVIARLQLKNELENRNDIIQQKTEEAVNLSSLSSQFSPQVVESIRSGKINLEQGGQRAQICTIFIDIVNSTERVTRIDKEKVDRVLSKFLDDSIRIMLKYDITIDKFLGDGLLAFCNAPLKRSDFVSRVVSAAIEIREKIKAEQEFFERNWQNQLEIRVGIAKGYANVGFYGSRRHYRSYTAIGPVVNLASRLCSSAHPNQVLTDYDVFETIQNEFEITYLGKRTLKGFDQDVIHTYEIISSKQTQASASGIDECPTCGSILGLEKDSQGHFVFVCRNCCTVMDKDSSSIGKIRLA